MKDTELPLLTRTDADRLTEGIRTALDRTARGMADLAERVSEAYRRRADLALGYESWADYAQGEFGDQTQALAAPIRRELVGYLSAEGMSTRAIAPAVSMHQPNVVRVKKRLEADQVISTDITAPTAPPVPVGRVVIAEVRHIDIETGEILDNPAPTRKVTGLDGKTYTPPPAQPKPIRPQLPGHYAGAIIELDKAINRLERLHADDRFNTNKKNVALTHESDIQRAITRLNHLKDELN